MVSPENYIYIFCSYIARMANEHRFTGAEAVFLMSEIEPVCESVKNREQLIGFINSYIEEFPELQELKGQLSNPVHEFAVPWPA
jgi:hypothetical protein